MRAHHLRARALQTALSFALVLVAGAAEDEVTLEEVRVEAVFVSPLELPLNKSIDELIDRLRLKDETARELELREANKSGLTKILELTRISPIGLGASELRVDTFLQENYLRADLNPRKAKSLFEP